MILHPHVITEQCVRPRIALARTSRKGSSIATGIRQDEKVCTRGHVPRRRRRLDRRRQVGQPGAHVDGDPADRLAPHTPRLWHRRARRARARSADDPQRFRPGPGRCRLPRADRIADGSAQCSGGRGLSGRRALLCRRLRPGPSARRTRAAGGHGRPQCGPVRRLAAHGGHRASEEGIPLRASGGGRDGRIAVDVGLHDRARPGRLAVLGAGARPGRRPDASHRGGASWVPPRFAWPRLTALREVLTFSRAILVGRLAWYVQTRSDVG